MRDIPDEKKRQLWQGALVGACFISIIGFYIGLLMGSTLGMLAIGALFFVVGYSCLYTYLVRRERRKMYGEPETERLKRKLKEIEARFEQREEESKGLEEELAQTKEEKRRLELERALKEKRAQIIDVKKERRYQLNGLVKINERRYKTGDIPTKEYKQTKERYERELKKLEKK